MDLHKSYSNQFSIIWNELSMRINFMKCIKCIIFLHEMHSSQSITCNEYTLPTNTWNSSCICSIINIHEMYLRYMKHSSTNCMSCITKMLLHDLSLKYFSYKDALSVTNIFFEQDAWTITIIFYKYALQQRYLIYYRDTQARHFQ